MRKIILTGAAGFVGKNLCRAFLEAGYRVDALVRRADSKMPAHPLLRVYVHRMPEVLSTELAAEIFSDEVVALVHCAYDTDARDPQTAYQNNTLGAQRLWQVSRACGVKKFIFISSLSAHAAVLSSYGRSKFAIEQMLHLDEDLVIRPGLIIGQGGLFARLCSLVRQTQFLPLFYGGQQPVQTIAIDELCLGVVAAIERNLTGLLVMANETAVPMSEFYLMIARNQNRSPWLIRFSGDAVLSLLHGIERIFGLRLAISSENLLGLKQMIFLDPGSDLRRVGLKLRLTEDSIRRALTHQGSAD